MANASVTLQIATLPDSAGVYQYYDKEGKLLYVGKAKNLKKRVSSYFTKNFDNNRTRLLVKKIETIKHIVVKTETDALLLENNLIKNYQPRYNVLLKDDKSYPWICIKNERFPRIFPTRRMIKDGSEYFGPYTSMRTVHTLLDLIKGLYPLRTCNYDLSEEKIRDGKYKVCLEYHLGNCAGPCEGLYSEKEYHENIEAIRNIVKGNFKDSLYKFKNQMKVLAADLKFEQAQRVKEKIDILVGTQMLTKGLDFRNVRLVGIMNADNLLNFPDFRAHERSFQLMMQVAGRAGRTQKRGKVLIQTYNPYHKIVQQVSVNDYEGMYKEQLEERHNYKYPPYYKLIRLTLKSRDFSKTNDAAEWIAIALKNVFPENVLGPELPPVARIRNEYYKNILVKIPPRQSIGKTKKYIQKILGTFKAIGVWRNVRVIINVDPY